MCVPWKSFFLNLLLHAGLHGLSAAEQQCNHQGIVSLPLPLVSLSHRNFMDFCMLNVA